MVLVEPAFKLCGFPGDSSRCYTHERAEMLELAPSIDGRVPSTKVFAPENPCISAGIGGADPFVSAVFFVGHIS